ncbi:MAG: DUF4191 domain-containing protein [Corynebacteriales bacterium]|nr:DUF4191 domain-containing protein [Mycobacteriales bacterium]
MAKEPEKVTFRDRVRQIGVAFSFTRKHDKLLFLWLALGVLVPLGIGLGLAAYFDNWLVFAPLAVVTAIIGGLLVFGRRVTKATFAEVEGKPGAAVAIVQNMRGQWRVTPAVAFTPQQDMVHRVVGRPGVILLIEGAAPRLKNMIVQEKKRINRVASDTPIYEVVLGDGEGEIPIRKLQSHFVKMPRNITARQVNVIEERLSALGARPPVPQGPLPKNARPPKMKMQRR